MTVRFAPANRTDAEHDLPEAAVECPVRDAVMRCEIPAGALDLRMKARGYVAEYRWNASLPPGQRLDLGVMKLRIGAAVTGRVRIAERGTKLAAMVRLVPRTEQMASQTAARTAQRSLTAEVNDRGFFHLDGVPPGMYTVVAEQKGFVAARSSVKVLENIESELIQPITLERPHRTDFAVSPPFDADNHPWRVTLLDLGAFAPRDGRTTRTNYISPGLYRVSGISSGRYQVSVENGAGQAFHAEAIEIDGSPSVIPISLSIIPVSGRVLLGKEPLSASIWFGGRRQAVSLQIDSDENGRFQGVLPHAGRWRVDVASESPRVERTLNDVEVRKREGSSASVEIALPATTLRVIVIDEASVPVENALVEAKGLDSSAQFVTDISGTLEAHGLPVGVITLYAVGRGTLASDDVTATLSADRTETVELHLREAVTINGVVNAAGSAVAGATVFVWPASQNAPTIKPSTTLPDGSFKTKVAPSTTAINIVVLSPGFALHAERVDVSASRQVRAELTQRGGTITIDSTPDRPPIVMRNGVPVFYPLLVQWSRLHGQRQAASTLVLQDMEPGVYSVCAAPNKNCSGGVLAALGSLSLRVAD